MGFSCSQTQSVTASAPSGAQREAIPLPTLPQTRFLRPVPSRGRPSFFPVFSHHAARNLPFWRHEHKKAPAFAPQEWPRRKRPLPFRGDPSFARPQVPHARQGYLQRKPIKKACGVTTGLSTFSSHTAQAIARTLFPGHLPASRPYRRHAAPAGTKPARLPGTGPSAGCSCCPGPPAGGCRTH